MRMAAFLSLALVLGATAVAPRPAHAESCVQPYRIKREVSREFPKHSDVGVTNNCTFPVWARICVRDQYMKWDDYFRQVVYLRVGASWGGLLGEEGLTSFAPIACNADQTDCFPDRITCTPTPRLVD